MNLNNDNVSNEELPEPLRSVNAAIAADEPDSDHVAEFLENLRAEAPSPAAVVESETCVTARKRRTPISGIVASAVLFAVVLLTAGICWMTLGTSVSLAEVVQNLQHATSYSADLPIVNGKHLDTYYYREPNESRLETKRVVRRKNGSEKITISQIMIVTDEPLGLMLTPVNSTYSKAPAAVMHNFKSTPLRQIQDLGDRAVQLGRRLDAKQIGGMTCPGFSIDVAEVNPEQEEGEIHLWIYPDIRLPAHIERHGGPAGPYIGMTNFSWNVDFDDAMFSCEPPEGYIEQGAYFKALVAKQAQSPARQARLLKRAVDGFRLFAELDDGKYPEEITNTSQLQYQMLIAAGYTMEGIEDRKEEEMFKRIERACRAIGGVGLHMFTGTPNTSYNGKTVTSRDKDKVLMRWNCGNNQLQLIYGDLRTEKVNTE